MSKCLTLGVALLLSTAATAQVGPQLAYATSGGRGAEVHLINADGTGDTLLYRGAGRSEIFHVDIKPGGGELAIEEHVRSNSPHAGAPISTIKIINYDAGGSIVGTVRALPLTCLTGSLDYHPTDGTLLYRNCSSPGRISRLNTTTLVSTDLGLAHAAFIASWLDATHILYYTNATNLAAAKFWTVSTDALGSPTEVLAYPSPGSLDTSTSGDKGLWSIGEGIYLLEITTSPPQITLFEGQAGRGHFSPDDQFVAFIRGGNAGGKFVLIRRFDGAGAPTNLAGRGNFTALDWRN